MTFLLLDPGYLSQLSVVPSTDSLLQSILKSPELLPLLMCRIKAVGI